MDVDKLRQIIELYREFLAGLGITSGERMSHDDTPTDRRAVLRHCRYMLGEMAVFVDDGKIEKAMRWLGFMQACFWFGELFTISELRDHSRTE